MSKEPKWYQSEEEQLLAGNPSFDPKERLEIVRNALGYSTNTEVGLNTTTVEDVDGIMQKLSDFPVFEMGKLTTSRIDKYFKEVNYKKPRS